MNGESTIKILIQFNGKEIQIPINPEDIQITEKASNPDIEVLGIGKATRKGDPGLITTRIKSFFPAVDSYFYKGVNPRLYIDFINEIWNTDNTNNNVAKIITTGLEKNLNMFFVIENFNYKYSAGTDDIDYELSIKEYRPYGVKLINSAALGMADARTASPVVMQDTSVQNQVLNTYTVQKNDCLWNITKACCGDGSRFGELYNLNKEVIGNNPSLIKPGQVLTLPQGWGTPVKVDKLRNVSKKNPPSTGKTNNNNATSTNKNTISENNRLAAYTLANAKIITPISSDIHGAGHSF